MGYSIVQDTIQHHASGEGQMQQKVARVLERIMNVSVFIAVIAVPLWLLPVTLDALELNKQTLIIILSLIALLCWIGRSILLKSFSLSRSWLHLTVGLFVAANLVSSIASQDRYLSFVGNFGQMQWAFATIASFFIFYLVIVNSVKSTTRVYNLLLAFLGSSAVVGLLGLCHAFGIYPIGFLLPMSRAVGFNTIGTMNSLATYMAIPTVLAASLLVLGCKDEECALGQKGTKSFSAKILVWFTLVVGVAIAVATDFWVVWAALLFGTVIIVGVSMARTRSIGKPTSLIVPGFLAVVSIVFLIFQTPLSLNLPGEVSPSTGHSWQIAKQTLSEHAIVGSGPGTWIYDYSKYRAPSVNVSQFWSVRFERGLSALLTLLATIGIFGTAAWVLLVLSGVLKSSFFLLKERNDDTWQAYLTVFSAWATVAFIAFFYNYNVSHHFVFWFLFAMLAALTAGGSFKWDGEKSPMTVTALSVAFLLISVLTVSMIWVSGQRLVADAKYSSAVNAFRAGRPTQESIDLLNDAVGLNRMNDVYYRNLSQAYLIRAGQTLQSEDADKGNRVSQLIAATVDTAKRATDISPANVDNWANLAVVYQSIASFTRGADEFAINNFQEALKREPNNPVFANEIGKMYILRSDAYRTLLSSKDEKARTEAETAMRGELDKAGQWLNQAIQAKPDFAPAHYNLGIMYERQGRVKDAITKLEQVLSVSNRDIGVGFQLAILYYRNNEKPKAQNMLERIVTIEPTYANARWYLATLYEEIGRVSDAVTQIKLLQQQFPDNQAVKDRLTQLTRSKEGEARRVQPLPEPIREEIKGPKPLNEVNP